MANRVVNIGVLAHVDAGKTSLSERLLYDYGTLDRLGSVDTGDTRMDGNELERERGITIQSAVDAFVIDALQVNLVDTPGHPDFIAEVERALSVLDGAVLVVSAVEGVQAQTRVIMRSLKAASIPTLIFVNKIDRTGARPEAVANDIARKLDVTLFPVTRAVDAGGEKARVEQLDLSDPAQHAHALEALIDFDMELLELAVEDRLVTADALWRSATGLTLECKLLPLYVGSALTGEGVAQLANGIATLLPASPLGPSPGEPVGRVFAVTRNDDGDRIAVARLFSGEVRERDEVRYTQTDHKGVSKVQSAKVTELHPVAAGADLSDSSVLTAGNIGRLRGLQDIRVGATIGPDDALLERESRFPSPTLEAVITTTKVGGEQMLYSALMSLSDEDPLIRARLRRDGDMSVLLYGEVQKEVITERLKREFSLDTEFSETTALFSERLAGVGRAEQVIDPLRSNDFWATIGLVLEPNPIGTGHSYHREVLWGQMPPGFYRAIEESALETLEQGLTGWPVLDCKVRLVKLGYDRPITVAADFRCLTPILVMRALQQARTRIYEPCQTFELDISKPTLGNVVKFLATQECEIHDTEEISAHNWRVSGEVPSRNVQAIAKSIPGLTHGEGAFVTFPGKDRLYHGEIPHRPRYDGNPLNYEEYMRYLTREGLMR